MDVEVPILSGYLNVPTQSGFPLNRISKRKSYQKYCLLFKSSRYGIERLEICESKEDKNPKIVTLENCVKITQEPSPANLICIVKKTATLTLNAVNEDSLKEWVNALQNVAFPNNKIQNISAIEEDNDLYCSSYGDGLFIVSLVPSEASVRCSIEPKCYILQLTATELQLKSTNGSKNVISNWPYRFIRKYGYRDGKFTFEAGRKCSTGEGVFVLDHSNPQDVFRCMSSKMKCMKKLISGEVPNIDSCENQLNAAASMEAGSRSPLPATFSGQHSVDVETNCNQIIRCFSSNDSNCHTVIQSSKNVPSKPPRKLLTVADKSPAFDSQSVPTKSDNSIINENAKQYKMFEPVTITSTIDPNKSVGSTVILTPSSPNIQHACNTKNDTISDVILCNNDSLVERDYESIEHITEAWRTLGINDVKHIENVRPSDDSNFEDIPWSRDLTKINRGQLKDPISIGVTSKIIDIDIGESNKSVNNILPTDFTYDRLEFLSANNHTSSGYKTIVSVTPISRVAGAMKPLQNEYEQINVPDIDSCRKADDSHLGYGVLRKLRISGALSATPTHMTTNSRNINTDSDTNKQDEVGPNYVQVNKPKIF
ncbi:uncharacterized protein LOC106081430 [Stomoxys calcitrans]|uniref:Uncharacterized protein n=1 Tax=Stomoxys calcitrans TaxID=35570 RepID=A0A1I8P553_STOCA|nr:uncharacterized protein LOC106081430 [Stomoxys calcitrans]